MEGRSQDAKAERVELARIEADLLSATHTTKAQLRALDIYIKENLGFCSIFNNYIFYKGIIKTFHDTHMAAYYQVVAKSVDDLAKKKTDEDRLAAIALCEEEIRNFDEYPVTMIRFADTSTRDLFVTKRNRILGLLGT